MDKINVTQWDQVFENTQQEVIFSSGHYTDVCFHFEEKGLASGTLQHLSTPGMQLIDLSINTNGALLLSEENGRESAESVFVLEGAADSRFRNMGSTVRLRKNNHNFQYNPTFAGEHLIHTSGFHALTVSYDLVYLQEMLASDHNRSVARLANSIAKKQTWMAATNAIEWQGRVTEIIHSIFQCPFNGVMKYIFLESKMLELFVLQMEQASCIEDNGNLIKWTEQDREKLYAVRQFISNSFLEEFSLKDLSYRFGLNEFKLKKGFREHFATTVFGMVYQLRMQKAKAVLVSGEMNVSEAAFFIGYNNVSSFSTEFRKRFGYSPGKLK